MSNLNSIAHQLRGQLLNTGWEQLLRTHLVSQDFSTILSQLLDELAQQRRFTPPLRQIMRPFQSCPLEKLRVVILCPEPYSVWEMADGLALSSGQRVAIPDSLNGLLQLVREKFNYDKAGDPDLTRWASQGVLLLNMSLTTRLRVSPAQAGAGLPHQTLWNPFLMYLLDQLRHHHPHVLWILNGLQTLDLTDDTPPFNTYCCTSNEDLVQTMVEVNERLGDHPIQW